MANVSKEAKSATSSLSFDEFVQVTTASALKASQAQLELGNLKIPPKIWVGIIIDPFSDLGKFSGGKG